MYLADLTGQSDLLSVVIFKPQVNAFGLWWVVASLGYITGFG